MAERIVGDTIFDISVPGRMGIALPSLDVPQSPLPPDNLLRDPLNLPEVSQLDIVRAYTRGSTLNFGVDTGTYPLGSCTMKYSPKLDNLAASHPAFAESHPALAEMEQGTLQMFYELQQFTSEITGMDATSLDPMAGAQGELAGMLAIKAFHRKNGETHKKKVLIPDSAHGTNPATAAMARYEVVSIKTDSNGNTDMQDLKSKLGPDIAAIMITYPSTLGLFDPNIQEITKLVHEAGAQVYCDGANMNAIVAVVRPGDVGADAVQLNPHKTFGISHGGGGPGAATVSVKDHLASFLPTPIIDTDGNGFQLVAPEDSIGRLGKWYGNSANLIRMYTYIRSLGAEGLRAIAENAVINANYIYTQLKDYFDYDFPQRKFVAHEVVLKGTRWKLNGVRTIDIAKRLIDYGFHPPTVYFPLIVQEALMIEPTESESKESIDAFIEAMIKISREAQEHPDLLTSAPHNTPVGRLDETKAARHPVLRWKPGL